MTLPKDELKRRQKKYKRREKKYKPKGWYIGGAHSAHPGSSFGEAKRLLDVIDWDDVPDSVKSAMTYELMAEATLREYIRSILNEM